LKQFADQQECRRKAEKALVDSAIA